MRSKTSSPWQMASYETLTFISLHSAIIFCIKWFSICSEIDISCLKKGKTMKVCVCDLSSNSSTIPAFRCGFLDIPSEGRNIWMVLWMAKEAVLIEFSTWILIIHINYIDSLLLTPPFQPLVWKNYKMQSLSELQDAESVGRCVHFCSSAMLFINIEKSCPSNHRDSNVSSKYILHLVFWLEVKKFLCTAVCSTCKTQDFFSCLMEVVTFQIFWLFGVFCDLHLFSCKNQKTYNDNETKYWNAAFPNRIMAWSWWGQWRGKWRNYGQFGCSLGNWYVTYDVIYASWRQLTHFAFSSKKFSCLRWVFFGFFFFFFFFWLLLWVQVLLLDL